MIITTNILMLPVVMLIWVLDAYLLLILIRQLGLISQTIQGSTIYAAVTQLTDPLIIRFGQWLTKLRGNHVPQSAAWTVLILTMFIVRHLLIALVSLTAV